MTGCGLSWSEAWTKPKGDPRAVGKDDSRRPCEHEPAHRTGILAFRRSSRRRSSGERFAGWFSRKDGSAVATGLYDEKSDPAETVNVADKPEHTSVVEALSKHLPPVVKR